MTFAPLTGRTGRDSPVRIDSSISRPSLVRTSPSAGTCWPAASRTTSSRTTWPTATSVSAPSLTTTARGVSSTDRRSRARLARISARVPVAVLSTRTKPNSASAQCPSARTRTSAAPRMPLKIVKTLARRICAALREVRSRYSLVCPALTRSATWAALSPLTEDSGGCVVLTRHTVVNQSEGAPPPGGRELRMPPQRAGHLPAT